MQQIDTQILRYTKDPCAFPEGSVLQSVYSGKIYVLTKHFRNGMCNMYRPDLRMNENWNACNNKHFISLDVSLPILCLIGN